MSQRFMRESPSESIVNQIILDSNELREQLRSPVPK